MGTKNNPGKFDCYEAAEPDEPMFVLLARDELAAGMVELWARLRAGDTLAARGVFDAMAHQAILLAGVFGQKATPKTLEARSCSIAMELWRQENGHRFSKPRRGRPSRAPTGAIEIGPGAPRT